MDRAGRTTSNEDNFLKEPIGNLCNSAWQFEFVLDRLNRSPSVETTTRFSSIGYAQNNSSRDAMVPNALRVCFLKIRIENEATLRRGHWMTIDVGTG